MTLEYVANTDLEITMTKVTMPTRANFIGGTHKLTTPPDVSLTAITSTNVKACGAYVCTSALTLTWIVAFPCPWTCTGSPPRYTFVAGVGLITATATKTRADGLPVLRTNDTGTCAGSWNLGASPFTPAPCACTAKITSAGQTKVKAQ